MKKDKFIRDFKIYNFVMNNIWQLLTTLIIGFIVGWLLEKYVGSERNLWMLFSIILAIMVGIANFFLSLYSLMKKIQKKEETENKDIQYIKYDDNFEIIDENEEVVEINEESEKDDSESTIEKND